MILPRHAIFLLLSASLAAAHPCRAQSGGHTFQSPTRVRLTCLVLGYDSVICYTGDDLRHAANGRLTDSLFLDNLVQQAKATGNPIVLKPCSGAGVIPNLRQVMNLAVIGRIGYSVDSTNAAEESTFNVQTPPMIKEMLRDPDKPPPPISVTMPKETIDTADTIWHVPPASRITIELSGDKDPFVYIGNDANLGKFYTTGELKTFLSGKSADADLSVQIRAAQDAAYHQFLDVLDILQSTHIRHYSLVSIPKP